MPNSELQREFEEFVESLCLNNFKASELLVATSRERNHIPSKDIWHNIAPTILILDALRDELDSAIAISSCYRAQEYNARLRGSAKLSQHQAFTAIDFSVRGVPPVDAAAVLKQWREEGRWHTSSIHLDRQPVTVDAGLIPFGQLPHREEGTAWHFQHEGGIGTYSTFVHLDTRGINATW